VTLPLRDPNNPKKGKQGKNDIPDFYTFQQGKQVTQNRTLS
jgi:hypothetical protein